MNKIYILPMIINDMFKRGDVGIFYDDSYFDLNRKDLNTFINLKITTHSLGHISEINSGERGFEPPILTLAGSHSIHAKLLAHIFIF